jgi:hypothetical protein
MASFGVSLVKTDISEECIASIIRVTRISEIDMTIPVTSNGSTLQRNIRLAFFAACF